MLGNQSMFRSSLSDEFTARPASFEHRVVTPDSGLLHAATGVFGARERADRWLREYQPDLACTPIDACTSLAGAAAVMKMLGAIANGWEI